MNGPVRARSKPFRMTLDVGMIGRGLERKVQSDLDPEVARLRKEILKILQRTQIRMNGCMPAFTRSDGPGTAYIRRTGGARVIHALARLAADRMNRRQVQNVEAHGGDVRQPRFTIAKGSMPAGLRRARSRKHFVPCRESRPLAIHHDSQLHLVPRHESP